ncbi:porin family protein [Candidatus Palauibacter sp.]|uniref:porin family protein n=1 Tax=Candidatus Palauibacter sp. TaxID=3101350 RepID=UPI003AF2BB96
MCSARLDGKEPDVKVTRWLAGLAVAALLAVTTLLASPGMLEGQRAFGVKGGVTFADAEFYDAFTSRHRARTAAGGFATFPISNRVDVQLDVLYMHRGFATDGEYQDGSTTRMSYLDFPVMLRLRMTRNPTGVRPFLSGGGYWAHEVGCRTSGGVAQHEQSDSCEGRFMRRGVADVGLIVGAGLEATVSTGWFLLLDARYNFGVRNLHWDPASEGAKARNLSFFGGVGVRMVG